MYKVCWDPYQHQLCMLAAVLEHTCWQQASYEPPLVSFAGCHWSLVQLSACPLASAVLRTQHGGQHPQVSRVGHRQATSLTPAPVVPIGHFIALPIRYDVEWLHQRQPGPL